MCRPARQPGLPEQATGVGAPTNHQLQEQTRLLPMPVCPCCCCVVVDADDAEMLEGKKKKGGGKNQRSFDSPVPPHKMLGTFPHWHNKKKEVAGLLIKVLATRFTPRPHQTEEQYNKVRLQYSAERKTRQKVFFFFCDKTNDRTTRASRCDSQQ